MLKLFLYGYLNKVSGSRRMETETFRNIELMWLLGELHPDHWTICEYRRENKEQIRFVTLEFRRFLKSENQAIFYLFDIEKIKIELMFEFAFSHSLLNRGLCFFGEWYPYGKCLRISDRDCQNEEQRI